MCFITAVECPGSSLGCSNCLYAPERSPTTVSNRRIILEVVNKHSQRLYRFLCRISSGGSAVDTDSCVAVADLCCVGDLFECRCSAVDTDSCVAVADLCCGGEQFASPPRHRLSFHIIRCLPYSVQANTEHSTTCHHNWTQHHMLVLCCDFISSNLSILTTIHPNLWTCISITHNKPVPAVTLKTSENDSVVLAPLIAIICA